MIKVNPIPHMTEFYTGCPWSPLFLSQNKHILNLEMHRDFKISKSMLFKVMMNNDT